MKFERISLEKYGAIAAREIDIANKPGLIIIYGPNEAGKSTLLCAIRDLLYGVPHTSPHGAIFGNNQIRIGATLRLADGSELKLRRKKGRPPGDLVDGNDQQVPTAQMEAMLAGTDRDRFNALFGLDHVSLRDGGQRLLASDGDIGRLIVEAGGGLRALVAALADLEKEAADLFSPNRSKNRKFYAALDTFEAADKEVKRATTTREAFNKSEKAAAAAAASLAALRSDQANARESIHRLERVKRTAPQLQLFAQTETELNAFADIEALADELATEIPAALTQRRSDVEKLAAAQDAVTLIQGQLDKFVIAIEIVDAAEAIEAVETLALLVEKATLDLPNRRAELAESNSQLTSLRALLGVDAEQDLEGLAPSRSEIEDVQSLASEAITLNSALTSAGTQLSECGESLIAIRKRQTEREAKGFDKPAQVPAAELLRLAPLARDLELKSRQIAEQQSSLEADALALGLIVSELKSGLWPTLAQVKTELDHAAKNESELGQAQSAHKTASARSERVAKRLLKLESGSQPPTPAIVAQARSQRDLLWQDIRSHYLDAPDEGWIRPPEKQRDEVASEFEQTRDAADDLVDRRGDEAQRLADIVAAERERSEAGEEAEAALKTINDLKEQIAVRELNWNKCWPDASAKERDLRRLLAFTDAREGLVRRQLEIEALRTALTQLRVDVEDLEKLLDQLETNAPTRIRASVSVRVHKAVSALKAHDDQYGDYRRDADEISKLKVREARLQQETSELTARQRNWSAAWSQAVSRLGLSEAVTPRQATDVATEWAGATGVFNAIRITATRIRRIKEDKQKLGNAIAELRERAGVELPEDAVAAARHLKRLLEESTGRKLQGDALRPQLDRAQLELEAALRRAHTSEASLADLASRCDYAPEDLEPLAPRIDQRRALRVDLNKLKQSIVSAGDGHSFESLREQSQGLDPDDLATQLADLSDQLAQRDKQIEAAIAVQQAADAEVRAFLDGDRLNGLVAERETASAEMHQVIERYVEITLAQSLLKAAIEKVRHEQQDPLIARASELFSWCTRGEFAGIGTDVSGDGEPVVVGLRVGGDSVHLSEMSDGTRDQLFLAFRLASIEHYARNAEPIPLIADDVLVHFDDKRGQATLELLAEIGSTTQVLLFTHHEAVVTAASALIDSERASVVHWGASI